MDGATTTEGAAAAPVLVVAAFGAAPSLTSTLAKEAHDLTPEEAIVAFVPRAQVADFGSG